MFKKIFLFNLIVTIFSCFLFSSNSYAEWEDNWNSKSNCIELNTQIPWLEKNWCIKKTEASETFWTLMWWLMKIAINITVAVAFIALIASWVMLAVSWANQSTAWKWKELLKKVVLWIVLIWLSWLILHTINPNFFKTSMIENKSMNT